MNAVDYAIGCILIINKGNIPSLLNNSVWLSFPHLSEIAFSLGLGWLCLCFLHSCITLVVKDSRQKTKFCFWLCCRLLLWLSFSVSPFPYFKVGTVHLAIFHKETQTPVPIFSLESTPEVFTSTFLQFWHNIDSSIEHATLVLFSPLFWFDLSV